MIKFRRGQAHQPPTPYQLQVAQFFQEAGQHFGPMTYGDLSDLTATPETLQLRACMATVALYMAELAPHVTGQAAAHAAMVMHRAIREALTNVFKEGGEQP